MDRTVIHGIGLMCGTSLDGLDIALCTFTRDGAQWSYVCNAATEFDLPSSLRKKLSEATEYSTSALDELDEEVGEFFAHCVNDFMDQSLPSPTYIASHGVTVFHQPENKFTMQIGSGKRIAEITGITTINDFRSDDVAKGGQGAPLVPYPDSLLFSEYEATLNLGGFANLAKFKPDLIGFDICPCNKPLNDLSESIFNLPYDNGGLRAREGSLNVQLFEQLNTLKYYVVAPPKSLGHEWYRDQFLPLQEKAPLSVNVMHTVTEHIAFQISQSLPRSGKVLCTGGGALNNYLVERIAHHSTCDIEVPNLETINFKEAIDFAFMGALRIINEPNIKASVTGAVSDTIAGTIHKAPVG